MTNSKTILITGASGNLGYKLWQHLEGHYPLRLLDISPRHEGVMKADLGQWDAAWVEQFRGVDTVVHLAANPDPTVPWATLIESNIDSVINVFNAAVQSGVKRVVYASSNHVMGGYQETAQPNQLTTDLPQKPGTIFTSNGQAHNSTPYGGAKLMGERMGKVYHDAYGLSTIAVRIGWVMAGQNLAADIPFDNPSWFRLMWLSNQDFCQLMSCCIEADPAVGFTIVNGISANTGTPWEMAHTKNIIGYEAQDSSVQLQP